MRTCQIPEKRAELLATKAQSEKVGRIFCEHSSAVRADMNVCRFAALKEIIFEIPTLPIDYIASGNLEPMTEANACKIRKELAGELTRSVEDRAGKLFCLFSLTPSVERYMRLRGWFINLYKLANYLSDSKEIDPRFAVSQILDGLSFAARIGNGSVKFQSDGFIEAFTDVKVERIRLCRVCGRVFWAGRIDMIGCTEECAGVLRTRRWREKTTSEQRRVYNDARAKKRRRI